MQRILGALVALLFCACGQTVKVKGHTDHNVNTTSTVDAKADVHTVTEVVLKIDVSGCAPLEGEAQASCITQTVKALGDLAGLVKDLMCKNGGECKGDSDGKAE